MPKQNEYTTNDYLTADEYKALLHKTTKGSVRLLGDFRTLNGTYKFFCEGCRLAFWNKAYNMLATEDSGRNHICGYNYANTLTGTRQMRG